MNNKSPELQKAVARIDALNEAIRQTRATESDGKTGEVVADTSSGMDMRPLLRPARARHPCRQGEPVAMDRRQRWTRAATRQ